MTVVMHHQPVLNFHTGFVAKVAEASRMRGMFLVHDLDTLRERGSCILWVPKRKGRGHTPIRLTQPRYSKKKLFTVGPATVTDPGRLEQALLTLADGKIAGNFRQRALEFAERFPEGRLFLSVAAFNVSILEFVLPRLGVGFPRTLRFSGWLGTSDWRQALQRFLEYYPEYAAALRELGDGHQRLPFWRWDRGRSERFQIHTLEEAADLISVGCLVPKGLELVWLIRVELGLPMIRGLGGASYERPLEEVARKLGKRIAPTTTVTSSQGVPAKWQPAVRDKNFRPSALLLWLMEGEFDHRSVIRR